MQRALFAVPSSSLAPRRDPGTGLRRNHNGETRHLKKGERYCCPHAVQASALPLPTVSSEAPLSPAEHGTQNTALTRRAAPSKHSRAARRETDVDIDTDKSLKNVKAPAESVDSRPAVLQAQHGAGITKKNKAGRKAVLSTKARRRAEKGADRAEAIMDRTANKKEKSRGHSKVIQGRAKNWEDVNKKSLDEVRRALMAAEDDSADEDEHAKDAAAAGEDKGAETDEEMDAAPVVAGKATAAAAAAAAAPAASDELDEEIL
ncbi:hypothetical protein D7B24_003962 [Verticillium nonalfalfae]|uniref:Alb1-domain-containing protein n=1 Tax=Verticillium nonalfalfae TaxID=1051616 RepID=A0A3M9YE86_9PEZI|nr:uncharacterized protein D7B24_003962 [Verticillium nonalfalfae]RNJ58873.1 hypothetical protein D7B24_003962 [Verticillium nonalfalfae]